MGQGVSLQRRKRQGAALLSACRSGSFQLADEIMRSSPAAAAYCPLDGMGPLHVAAASGDAELVERLLTALQRAGRERQPKAARRSFAKTVNQKNMHGQTPLMLACKACAPACVRLLLGAGADATLFDGLQQRNALHYAALYGCAEAVDALLSDDSRVDTAAGQPQQLLRDALLADSQGHHRYIDSRASHGTAPLHLAAHQGHLAAVQRLIHFGASLTVRCNVAASLGHTDPWTPSSTPLHFAAARGRAGVVLAILQAAAQRQRQGLPLPIDPRLLSDFRGMRPCDVAAAHGHRSLLWALNPRVPLAALLRPLPSEPAVPTLASLAAASLRQCLVQQLAGLREAAASASAASTADAGIPPGKRSGSRRGSRAASREGSAHGGSGYAALAAAAGAALLPAAVVGRLGRYSGSGGPRVAPATSSLHGGTDGHASSMTARHARRASDGGIGASSTLHNLRLFSSVHSGSVGGSRRSIGGPPAQFAAATLPLATPAAEAVAAPGGSVAGCRTATSVTSVAGCPVCLDSCLEVAVAPCRHGLCLDCAQHLCAAEEGGSCGGGGSGGGSPPLCPLCRGLMAGFQLLA